MAKISKGHPPSLEECRRVISPAPSLNVFEFFSIGKVSASFVQKWTESSARSIGCMQYNLYICCGLTVVI